LRDKKTILFIITGLIIIIGIYFSLNYQPGTNQNSPALGQKQNSPEGQKQGKGQRDTIPDNQFKGAQLVFFNSDGSITLHLDSKLINNYSRKNHLNLSTVKIDVSETEVASDKDKIDLSGGKLLYTLTAVNSIYNTDTGVISLNGPVRIDKDKINLTAGQVIWQDKKDIISGTGGIKIESPSFIINGGSFRADLALNSLRITGKKGEQAAYIWKKGSGSNQ
jgi:LPS export ABC transporter protein LptC